MTRPTKHRSHIRKRERAIRQDSAFLNLPAEIKILIYHLALVKPHHIDLVPADYLELDDSAQDPLLEQKLIRKRAKCTSCHKRPGDACACVCVWTLRYQRDLQFVRKELATGLLATCKQIFNEAQYIYWHENTFRFTDDCLWYGVRRFLATIGSRARSQLRSLEIRAPIFGINPIDYRSAPTYHRRILGNFPKLHMQKFSHAKDPGYWNYEDDSENIEAVFRLLNEARVELDLRFIVPTGQYIDVMRYDIPFTSRTNRQWQSYHDLIEPPDVHLNEQVLKARPLWNNGMTLILEAGAQCRDGLQLFERCAYRGVNVVCYPGSYYRATPNIDEITEITEIRWWTDPNADLEKYSWVSDLFIEQDDFSVPGRGGRATKGTGQKNVMRHLKGFGGCRFVERFGFECVCGRIGIYSGPPEKRIGLHHCDFCGTPSYEWQGRKVVDVKSMSRAVRNGQVDKSMVLTRKRFQLPTSST